MLSFHLFGPWKPGAVCVDWRESGRLIVPEVEALIERTWVEATGREGIKLFDGPMCRVEGWREDMGVLRLSLSRTSYKPFLGTNLRHPNLADRFGREILACPLGVSPALLSSDDYFVLGKRNHTVAYYPGRLHPFAGAAEPSPEMDVFSEVKRELAEELGFCESDIAEIMMTGIVEDVALRQPESIFAVRSTRTLKEIKSMVAADEHAESWSIPATPEAMAEALRVNELLTPVARASMLLWGRITFGQEWFDSVRELLS